MPFKLGPLEIGLILVIILIIFGVGKLPQVGGAIGKAIREFRKSKDNTEETEATSTKAAKTPPEDNKPHSS